MRWTPKLSQAFGRITISTRRFCDCRLAFKVGFLQTGRLFTRPRNGYGHAWDANFEHPSNRFATARAHGFGQLLWFRRALACRCDRNDLQQGGIGPVHVHVCVQGGKSSAMRIENPGWLSVPRKTECPVAGVTIAAGFKPGLGSFWD